MIDKLNHYSMTNPASVYDEEALTALELAGRTATKMNQTVEAFNELEKETGEHLNAQDKDIQNQKDVVIPERIKDEVQNQIDNGTFDQSIASYMGNLNERLDNFLENTPTGSTSLDAEVLDVRVGFNGKTYESAGASVREQNEVVFEKADRFSKFYNHFKVSRTDGYLRVSDDMTLTYADLTTYASLTSELISCSEGDKFSVVGTGWGEGVNYAFLQDGIVLTSGNVSNGGVNTKLVVTAPEHANQVIFSSMKSVDDVDSLRLIVRYCGTDTLEHELAIRNSEADKLIGEIAYTVVDGYLCLNDFVKPNTALHSKVSKLIRCRGGETFVYNGMSYAETAGWVFYDENGLMISSGNSELKKVVQIKVVAPEGASFARFTSIDGVGNDITLHVRSLDANTLDKRNVDELSHIEKSTSAYFITEHSGYLTESGAFSADENYHCKVTTLIKCSTGEQFRYRGRGWALALSYRFFDADGLFVSSGITGTYSPTTMTVTIPDGVSYVQFASAEEITKDVVLEIEWLSGETVESKIREAVTTNTTAVNPILNGKKWYACGDSFTEGDFTGISDSTLYTFQEGTYKGQRIMYPQIIGLRNNMVVVNHAKCGQTMTVVSGIDNTFSLPDFTNGYQKISADADYITIRLGINDGNQSAPVGTIDDETNTTFYGAWNIVLRYLITNHPYAKIGVIISNGCGANYCDAMRAVCEKWGIPYLDMASDIQVPVLHRTTQRTNLCDEAKTLRLKAFRVSESNTHPNVEAEYYESTFIENWLCSL